MFTDWRPSPSHWFLTSTDVHVWRVTLDVPEASLIAFRALLSADERARADRYHFPADARRYSVARGVLRRILSRFTAVAPEALAFDYNAHGKPSLRDCTSTLSFNVSHAGERALIAVAGGPAVGVDIEPLRSIDAMNDLARQHFSVPEQQAFYALPVPARQRVFFEVWTRKEAVLKALGVGLSREPATIDVWGGGQEPHPVDVGDPAETPLWTLMALDPGAGYVGALAVRAPTVAVQTWDLQADELPSSKSDSQATSWRGKA